MFTSSQQETYLAGLIEEGVAKFKSKTKWSKIANYVVSVAIIVLSSLLTVTLGLNFDSNGTAAVSNVLQVKNYALIIGASITLLSALKAFWKLDTYWIRRKIMFGKYEDLQYEFKYKQASNSLKIWPHCLNNTEPFKPIK
ncbi:SLATT domain-containing protein [Mucilaginibacter sp.]|uniref:SLATT domain-containing protein n=1 Tax=Mucilaginibacter sp. TaxID=1882438 RepID=UPI0026358680|nr:SLATT domain-containing protein [Mucilaginibacter sp.]MDB4919097.1 phenylalanyl-tRNA synthetase beta subunit [Mucilaginibacter sp.]